MKTINKIKENSIDKELFKIFNESLDYTPQQMQAAIAEATEAMSRIEEEEVDDLISFKEDFFLLADEFN